MKKHLALFLAVLMAFSITGCGKKKQGDVVAVLYPVDTERAVMECIGAVATKQYILARLKTDALLEYDFENGSIEELKNLTEDAMDAWRLSYLASSQTRKMVDYGEGLELSTTMKAGGKIEQTADFKLKNLFVQSAYAAKSSSSLEWAKALTEKFDSYPMGRQIKHLAEDMEVDAKTAFTQLKIAQEILGGAYNDEAEAFHRYEQAAKGINATCKTVLFVAGTASGGLPSGILEVGGLLIGGIDTLVTVTEAGAHIFLGENNTVTITAQEYQEVIGPIAAVAGGIGLFTGDAITSGFKTGATFADKFNSLDKISYVVESVGELINEGTIVGGMIDLTGDGKTTLNISEVSTEGKSPEQVAKELKEAGLPVPENSKTKTATELADEMEKESYYTEEEIKELINNLRAVLYDAFLTFEEEINEDANNFNEDGSDYNQQSNEEIIYTGKSPSKEELVGTYYEISSYSDDDYMLILLMDDEGRLTDMYGFPFDYDPTSGIGSFIRDNSDTPLIEEYKFSYQNGYIYAYCRVWYNYENTHSLELVKR
ncbi:MAG: hypothetical protein GX025_00185 [Clostridiales bacterium]|nr:hypothetical protein [Clostridiales bacterium]